MRRQENPHCFQSKIHSCSVVHAIPLYLLIRVAIRFGTEANFLRHTSKSSIRCAWVFATRRLVTAIEAHSCAMESHLLWEVTPWILKLIRYQTVSVLVFRFGNDFSAAHFALIDIQKYFIGGRHKLHVNGGYADVLFLLRFLFVDGGGCRTFSNEYM